MCVLTQVKQLLGTENTPIITQIHNKISNIQKKEKTNLSYKSLERLYLRNFENYFPSIFLLFAISWIIIFYTPFRNNKPKTNTSLRVKLIVFFFLPRNHEYQMEHEGEYFVLISIFFFLFCEISLVGRGRGGGKGDVKASKELGKKKTNYNQFLLYLTRLFSQALQFFFYLIRIINELRILGFTNRKKKYRKYLIQMYQGFTIFFIFAPSVVLGTEMAPFSIFLVFSFLFFSPPRLPFFFLFFPLFHFSTFSKTFLFLIV